MPIDRQELAARLRARKTESVARFDQEHEDQCFVNVVEITEAERDALLAALGAEAEPRATTPEPDHQQRADADTARSFDGALGLSVDETGRAHGLPLPHDLDVGISEIVALLVANGFITTDSGDGVSKPDAERSFDVPHVACYTTPARMVADAERAQRVLGHPWVVEASYATDTGTAVLFAHHPWPQDSCFHAPPSSGREEHQ